MPPATLFTDADNTLWETDAVFAAAQLTLLAEVEDESGRTYSGEDRLAFVRSIDQALAERHHAGLRYPPRLLARATALALTSMPPRQAARLALKGGRQQGLSGLAASSIEDGFVAVILRLPALRPGVREGLEKLHAVGCRIFVVTEGPRRKVQRTAAAHGIAGHLGRIIESPKRPELYRRILRLAGMPARALMVGDQLDRDIVPASAAGLETIWFPGGFRPSWEPALNKVGPSHIIESFAEVPPIVMSDVRSAP